jgi:DNA-binding beta-propeller fold protein YncE
MKSRLVRSATLHLSTVPGSITGLLTLAVALVAFFTIPFTAGSFSTANAQEKKPKLPPYFLALAVADDGTVFLADRQLPGIWRHKDGETTIYHRASSKFRTPLNAIRCLAFDRDGNLLAGDSSTREVYRFVDDKPQPLTGGTVGIPMGIAVNSKGQIFVTDLESSQVKEINIEQKTTVEFAKVAAPVGIAIDSADGLWVVSRSAAGQVVHITAAGEATNHFPNRPFQMPHNLSVGDDGSIRIVDGFGKKVWTATADTAPKDWAVSDEFVNPVDIKRSGDFWLVVDPRAAAFFRVDAQGAVEKTALPKSY